MSKVSFLFHSIQNFSTVGSITPSSRFLVNALVAPIDPARAKCIVELGAGEGCVTRKIQNVVNADCIVLAFEMHKSLIELSKKNSKKRSELKENVLLIHDDAEHVKAHLQSRGIPEIDYVVSSLPLAQIPNEKIDRILENIKKNLHADGLYIQYQYSLASYRHLKKHFSSVKIRFVPLNIFPAFVYICKK